MTQTIEQLFFPKGPGGCIWNLVAIGPGVTEEKSFEIVDGRQTMYNAACLYYKLPRSLRLRWAKNGRRGQIFSYKGDLLWRYMYMHSSLFLIICLLHQSVRSSDTPDNGLCQQWIWMQVSELCFYLTSYACLCHSPECMLCFACTRTILTDNNCLTHCILVDSSTVNMLDESVCLFRGVRSVLLVYSTFDGKSC